MHIFFIKPQPWSIEYNDASNYINCYCRNIWFSRVGTDVKPYPGGNNSYITRFYLLKSQISIFVAYCTAFGGTGGFPCLDGWVLMARKHDYIVCVNEIPTLSISENNFNTLYSAIIFSLYITSREMHLNLPYWEYILYVKFQKQTSRLEMCIHRFVH